MTLVQQKEGVLGIIRSIGALRAKPECASRTNSLAALFFLADAYAHLSLVYTRKHNEQHPMMRKAEKALNQAIECLDLIKGLSKETTEVIDNDFVKKCNTFGICDVDEARNSINHTLIDLLIQNTEGETFVTSSTAESSCSSIKRSS